MTKFCKDCIHYENWESRWKENGHICNVYMRSVSDVVTGEYHNTGIIYCYSAREEGSSCGPEGKLWEARYA